MYILWAPGLRAPNQGKRSAAQADIPGLINKFFDRIQTKKWGAIAPRVGY